MWCRLARSARLDAGQGEGDSAGEGPCVQLAHRELDGVHGGLHVARADAFPGHPVNGVHGHVGHSVHVAARHSLEAHREGGLQEGGGEAAGDLLAEPRVQQRASAGQGQGVNGARAGVGRQRRETHRSGAACVPIRQ